MKIAVLLSGGVDSSVALRLVKQAGHRDIAAFYLKIWLEDELAHLGNCPWEEDLQYARAVCSNVNVPTMFVWMNSPGPSIERSTWDSVARCMTASG